MFIPLLLLLSPVADAVVRLKNSELYDEVDFKNVAQISTNICAAGCKVYSTILITTENTKITQNIFINDPNTKKDTSIGDLSSLFLQGTDDEKAYLEMGKAPIVTISNRNKNLESAPLALWIVSANSPYFRTAEVYQPLNVMRKKATAPDPITFLSAYPFTVTVQPGDSNAAFARTVGYDAIDRNKADGCYPAMDMDFGNSFNGFTLSINGPLLTLAFDGKKYPNSKIELKASNGFGYDLFPFPNQPVYLSSPGFVCGSPSSSQIYRSSSLAKNANYTLKTPNNKEMKFYFDIDVVSDIGHPVTVYDQESQSDFGFYGNFKDHTNSVQLSMQTPRVIVSFTPGTGDSFFGMRVNLEDPAKSWSTSTIASMVSSPSKMTSALFESTTSAGGTHSFITVLLAFVVLLSV